MLKLILSTHLILSIFTCLVLTSCGGDDDSLDSDDYSQNSVLVNTKWTTSNRDFSVGDDWIGTFDEVIRIYFYSNNEGCIYYGDKNSYSDLGTSSKRNTAFFNYNVNGSKVKLTYITPDSGWWNSLTLQEGTLFVDGFSFTKDKIDHSDTQWLSTIHGSTGECSWYTDLCGSLWIRGDGAMADYSSYASTPWAKNNRTPNKLIINEGVTSIGSYAFANSSIESVEMPDKSLTQIGQRAFSGTLITAIWLSDNVSEIGQAAFDGCKKLESINIPKELVIVGASAFEGCTSLKMLTMAFGEKLRTIGDGAFADVTAWKLTFAEGVQDIGSKAFLGTFCTDSRELILPNSLTSVGATAFQGSFNKIVIGTNLATIGSKAFITSASSGSMYVNRSTPPSTNKELVVEKTYWNSIESNWTLHVPTGCKSAFSSKTPWSKFKSITGDSTLDGGNSNATDDDDSSSENDSDKKQDELDAQSGKRGVVATGFHGGSGTFSDPYQIATAAELRYFSDAVRKGNIFKNQYVKLTANITINKNVLTRFGELNGDGSNFEPWIPIGRYDPSYFFCGTFDGDGHYVSGLYCNRPKGENIGFFGRLYGNVKNLEIRDSYFCGAGKVGGIASTTQAYYIGTTIPTSVKEYYQTSKKITITNCKNSATIKGDGLGYAGGIIGCATNYSTISKCLNNGIIYNTGTTGGIIGSTSGSSEAPCLIRDCCNTAEIISTNTTGGILGSGLSQVSVVNCLNKGRINTSSSYVGGICGALGRSSSYYVKNCVNLCTNIKSEKYMGAIIGFNNGIKVTGNYYIFKDGLPTTGRNNGGSSSNNKSLTESEIKDSNIIDKLNSAKSSSWSSWKLGNDGYPILEWME